MAVRLRLMRMGKKKQPTYRVVAADSRSPRDGRFIEIIGTYQPRLEPSGVKIDVPRAVHWLNHGARPSEAVEKLLKITGAWAVFKGEAPMPEPEESQSAEGGEDTAEEPAAAATPAVEEAEPATEDSAADDAAVGGEETAETEESA
jgi:small subunit ribosomal protein S16